MGAPEIHMYATTRAKPRIGPVRMGFFENKHAANKWKVAMLKYKKLKKNIEEG